MNVDWNQDRVCVTGGAGFLGQYVCRELRRRGVTDDRLFVPRSRQYDLTREANVVKMYEDARPDFVIHLAAEVGGIGANREHPGRFCFANMAMGMHLIEQGRIQGIKKFVQTGTVCAYPKHTPVPFKEEALWDGYPEETNAPYGVAKKSLFVMLDSYKREYGLNSSVVVPVNLYGPGDNFDLQTSHVIPALIRKCIEARRSGADHIECWGTGQASREFLYAKDAAVGLVAAAERIQDPSPINLGTGKEITIRALTERIASLCQYSGEIRWNPSQPDGQHRRSVDASQAEWLLDWQPRVELEQGLKQTVAWFEAGQIASNSHE